MGNKKRILVVDDDSMIGEMLKALLEFKGFEVTVTQKTEETEKIILLENIDLVILDMLIAGVNGTEVCALLKKADTTAHIPILMMSALHNAGKICKEAGADDFIPKPFEMEDLLSKINNVLSKDALVS